MKSSVHRSWIKAAGAAVLSATFVLSPFAKAFASDALTGTVTPPDSLVPGTSVSLRDAQTGKSKGFLVVSCRDGIPVSIRYRDPLFRTYAITSEQTFGTRPHLDTPLPAFAQTKGSPLVFVMPGFNLSGFSSLCCEDSAKKRPLTPEESKRIAETLRSLLPR